MKNLLKNNHAEGAATMVGVVIAGLVSIIVGVLIWYKINNAVFTAAQPSAKGTTAWSNIVGAFNSTNASANTIWTLFPLVAIVVVAGIILAVVMGYGGQST